MEKKTYLSLAKLSIRLVYKHRTFTKVQKSGDVSLRGEERPQEKPGKWENTWSKTHAHAHTDTKAL